MSEQFTKVHDGRSRGYSWTGPKWACDTCGRSGYSDPSQPRGYSQWFTACERGHSPCEWCGRQLTLRLDGTPRVHSRCKERPDEAELLRLLAAEVVADVRLGVRGPLTSTSMAVLDRLTRSMPTEVT